MLIARSGDFRLPHAQQGRTASVIGIFEAASAACQHGRFTRTLLQADLIYLTDATLSSAVTY